MTTKEVVDIVDKKEKKEKKSKDKSEKKKEKRSDSAGVTKEKKDKKKDKAKQEKLARAAEAHLNAEAAAAKVDSDVEVDPEDLIKPAEELVPFAFPLADDKTHKKIYKLIKKGACTAIASNRLAFAQTDANLFFSSRRESKVHPSRC